MEIQIRIESDGLDGREEVGVANQVHHAAQDLADVAERDRGVLGKMPALLDHEVRLTNLKNSSEPAVVAAVDEHVRGEVLA